MASGGYPGKYDKGYQINVGKLPKASTLYIAGASRKGDKLFTNGGRVLGLTAISDTLKEAIDSAYQGIKKIDFNKAYYRKDIGLKALKALI